MQTATLKPRIARHPALWLTALRNHWPEYFMEAAALGIFMISACVFGVLGDSVQERT
jgi:hypothetical protein